MPELLDKAKALYFEPESIGSPDGARCDICWKFNRIERTCFEVEGAISGPRGGCGLYVNGEPRAHLIPFALSRKLTKAETYYSEKGPTHCGNCEEMIVRKVYASSPCKKVKGMVDGRGCCNLWQVA